MTYRIAVTALVGALLLGASGIASAQTSSRHYRGQRTYDSSHYYDYDGWASRHSQNPGDRSGAGNFKNLTPPAGGIGRVNSQTQN